MYELFMSLQRLPEFSEGAKLLAYVAPCFTVALVGYSVSRWREKKANKGVAR